MVVNQVGQRRGDRSGAHIERHLNRFGTLGIKALRQHGNRAQNQRFREAEFENSDQDEQEVDRQRPRNPGQAYLEP